MNDIEEQSPNLADKKHGTRKRSRFLMVFLLLSVIILTVVVYAQASNIREYKNELTTAKARVSKLEQFERKAAWFDRNVAFITKTGEKYHKFDCQYVSFDFSVCTLEQAKAKGFEPCGVCRKLTLKKIDNE